MYWVQNLVELDGEDLIVVAYYHIDPTTKELTVHTKISKDEDEFIHYYQKVKSI